MPQIDIDGATSKISADTIRGQSGTTVTVQSGHNLVGSGSGLTALNATNLASGTLPDARFPATLPAASGVNLTALNATNLGSGTVPTARLGSGTANSSVHLRGDGTWAAAGGGSCTLISVQDVDAAEVDFEPTANSYALADYTAFLFIFTTVWSDSASAATLYMRAGYDDGTYHTGGYGRAMHAVDHDAAEALEGNTGAAGQWQLMDVAPDTAAGIHNYAYQATLWVPSYAAATTRSFQIRASGTYGDDGGDDLRMVHCVGNIHNASSSSGYDSFRFWYSAGNVNGRISMYGYKDS